MALAATTAAATGSALARPMLLVSTENGPDHVQTRIVRRFVERVIECCADRVEIDHRFGGELYRDRDVLAALIQGKVGMAVAGTWQLGQVAPDVGAFMMPALYGRSAEETALIQDGPAVEAMNSQIEDGLGAVVLGRWIGLGFAQVFSTRKRIDDVDDLVGLRVRSPGGVANAWRLAALGAEPITIAWADLPRALAENRIDGLISSFATLDSISLWRRGVRFALEDRQYFSHYVPLVSDYFWRRIDEATRRDLRDAWNGVVEEGRVMAARAQEEARNRAVAAGVRIVTPTPERTAAVRARLLAGQEAVMLRSGVSRQAIERVTEGLRE
ncbi:C4-dicarboxylate ABC transporter substrate-binding protein [Skermanella stibiiresistens SB22]|uniref:C4-dicarboxylate ABC transporter substrate-binding protein n=1 Tax=Skermanella stibiiresistens SB22 TaxID=1385369 RepID=W9H5X8_9PROT|nr:TRAP transporter substrate-binding protein DctP [Skermanella stibiiresistens]EWY39153.1 C4-dicarboxylate ABC transporter substrate-binding protein [Skermanella stibiiresistens SB22]